MAVASLVFGIISIVCGVFGFGFRWGGILLAVLGMIFAGKNKETDKASIAKAGKICSIVGLIICLVMLIVSVALVSAVGSVIGVGALDGILEFGQEQFAYFFE